MKLLLIFLLLFPSIAKAEWTDADTVREAVYLSVLAIDWGQTLQISKHQAKGCTYTVASGSGFGTKWSGDCDYSEMEEVNPLLGKHPSNAEINRFFIAGALLHYAIAKTLPSEWREPFQYLGIGLEIGVIGHNFILSKSF